MITNLSIRFLIATIISVQAGPLISRNIIILYVFHFVYDLIHRQTTGLEAPTVASSVLLQRRTSCTATYILHVSANQEFTYILFFFYVCLFSVVPNTKEATRPAGTKHCSLYLKSYWSHGCPIWWRFEKLLWCSQHQNWFLNNSWNSWTSLGAKRFFLKSRISSNQHGPNWSFILLVDWSITRS